MKERAVDVMLLAWRVWYPLAIYSVFGMGTAAMMQQAGFSPYGGDALLSAAAAALAASACLGILYIRTKNTAPPRGRFHIRAVIWTVLAGIGSCFFVNNMIMLAGLNSAAYEKASAQLYGPPFSVRVVAIGFLIPAAEELVFRGLGYLRLRRKLPFFWAALLSALYFGSYHGNIVQGVYASCLGFLLAGVCEAYSSLWAPVCLHVAANLSSLMFTELAPTGLRLFKIPFLLVSGIILLFGLYKIREDVKKREITVDSNPVL